ncbi:MAG TPA: T9SS type A sorting domain-containing protein [Bacteroidia bacterium]|nr:T9SS type A sorting domain-containing protein [Bacteroidia bacterium]
MKTFYKRFLALSFYLSISLLYSAYGQGENNIWYFGFNSGLDFNSGSPVVITNGQTYTREGVASISDAAGNLLFYTDGQTVWDRNHVPMSNGTGLLGAGSSTQSATIVPMPGSSTQYYIFTCPANELPGDFHYSVVDMTLASGNGDVTSKNILLFIQSSEKCVAVYKNGSPDIWVIAHDHDTTFYSYLVTSSGINAPVISFSHAGNVLSLGYMVGFMKASPTGDKIAAALYETGGNNDFALYDFNCNNGTISNERVITPGGSLYGLEFSPDGTKLYVAPWCEGHVDQFDVTLNTAAAIAASQITVGNSTLPCLGGMQIGPDQKIYVSIDGGSSISVINNPNLQGVACNYVDNAIVLAGNQSGIGLPALIGGSVCNTITISENQNDGNEFQIFPNPSDGIFQITFPNFSNPPEADGKVSCEVINTLGQTVFHAPLPASPRWGEESSAQLDLSFLAKGIYVLKINDGVSAFSSKFVIE